eukprot:CAMPEP_0181507120 /NCGR_PEP_ID=MMETSP1110-20121109/58971_1 /TAXON_ID=174948 /ORGANISM="Symbiodinium sp., Strain CCMP421" /LENGTH=76 /DNA_ID=CAMNT_0023636249 /DNA_START=575 /DNA_END=805 /DNA_ORIENTATION=-
MSHVVRVASCRIGWTDEDVEAVVAESRRHLESRSIAHFLRVQGGGTGTGFHCDREWIAMDIDGFEGRIGVLVAEAE